MEFFELFLIFFVFCNPLTALDLGIDRWSCYTALLAALGVYAVIYAFKATALYTMAKRAGKDKLVWCAFVPVASTYLMGELAGEARLFGLKIKKLGLIAMLAELVAVLTFVCAYAPLFYIFEGGYYIEPQVGDTQLAVAESLPVWIFNCYKTGNILYDIFSWIYVLTFVLLYITVFRTYYARGHVLFTIFSVLFPFSAFFLFAVRNNAPVNYEQYMQQQVERMRRAQQNNPYGPNGPYGGNSYGGAYGQRSNGGEPAEPIEPEDPFGEYSSGTNSGSSSRGSEDNKDDPDDFFN